MITHDLQQGADAWLALRAKHFCASEAAAMLGLSDKTTRNELIRMKATGAEKEFSEWVKKNLLEKGHEVEAQARTVIEAKIGEELYPVTGTLEFYELPLLASFDGITMEGGLIFENKLWNERLAACVKNNEIPDTHWPQIEQQLLVSGADQAIFSVSDGTPEGTIWTHYRSQHDRCAQLIAGWKRFAEDLKNYQPAEFVPSPVASSIEDLPALSVEIIGEVRGSNIVAFRRSAMTFIDTINTDLQTDDDFATAEQVIKFCDEAEKRLDLVKKQALSQTASIDELFRNIDTIKAEMREKRLQLDKLVKSKKETIRFELIQSGKNQLAAHLAALNRQLDRVLMPPVEADFIGAIKGKKTIDSLKNAVDTVLANSKIQADMIFSRIQENLKTLDELGKDYPALFADLVPIVGKATDDFTALVKSRIADHKTAEQKRQADEQAKAQENRTHSQPAPPAPALPVTPAKAEQPEPLIIREFLKTRDFGKAENRIRAVLVEFIKFQETKHINSAA